MEVNIFDFYCVESLLTEEEKLIRDTVRNFVEKEIKPIVPEYYEKGEFPVHIIPKLAELGLLETHIDFVSTNPISSVAEGLIIQELEAGDAGIRTFVSVQTGMAMNIINQAGTKEQKERYLPKMARGEIIGCYCLSEHDAGSDPASMKTKAIKKGDRWILNGTKMWITNGTIADIAIVWAKDENNNFQAFIVNSKSKGYKANKVKGKLSLRTSDTAEIVLEDVEVPEEERLPGTAGLKTALSILNRGRYELAWAGVGAALDCFKTAVAYSKTRIQFDKPIAAFQLTQEKLAYMLTEITKAQLLCIQLGRLKDKGTVHYAQIAMAKRNNIEMASKVAQLAREILAGSGILQEYPVFRHFADLEAIKTYEGTNDIQLLIVGQYITGISAFR
jgi:glutaryl-CoA dehydrogenase